MKRTHSDSLAGLPELDVESVDLSVLSDAAIAVLAARVRAQVEYRLWRALPHEAVPARTVSGCDTVGI
jgi:hypothetical protein